MATHPIVVATIRRHLAEAELRLAELLSKQEEIPTTRVSRQITQMKAQHQSWTDMLNAAETMEDE